MLDYYEILGVKRTATTEQIKIAYRNLAKKHHPDLNGSDHTSDDMFKNIVAAHETLKDPKKRIKYDVTSIIPLTADGVDLKRQANFAYKHVSAYVGDVLSKQLKIFQQRISKKRGADVKQRLVISLAQLYAQTTISIKIPKRVACQKCKGCGLEEAIQSEFEAVPCKICDGTSLVGKVTSFQLSIPKGHDLQLPLHFSKSGSDGAFGGPAGDHIISLDLAHDPVFEKVGYDLILPTTVKFSELMFGKELDIHLPDGKKTKITIPPGTQPSKIFKLSNLGFYHPNSLHRGQLHIHLYVSIPSSIPEKAQPIIQKLQEALPGF